MKTVLYIHGKGGNASESTHYENLFPDCKVIGLDYKSFSPWETGKEIREAVASLKKEAESIILIANSIGAFFSMNANLNGLIEKAYFISPIVNMEKLICDMMNWANVTEAELEQRKIIPTDFGEELSWEYLCYVRAHPLNWKVPTSILYGEKDNLTSIETIKDFAEKQGASLTVMKDGEHWFHTEEEMKFLDEWIGRQK
ncbi:MAG: alpha/beta hydrolase [Treponema sp.]|nr:alpha/beta hydrolase [Treponema sp.]